MIEEPVWTTYVTISMTTISQSTLRVQALQYCAVAKRVEAVAKALGRRIRELRKQKGWSQERLADEAAMHRTYMWGIERGSRNPSIGHLTRIADALEVPLSALFKAL